MSELTIYFDEFLTNYLTNFFDEIFDEFFQDAIQAQFVIQKMSELTTQEKESSDDLEPISEASPSKTLDEDHESR